MKNNKWVGRNQFDKSTLEERFWEKVIISDPDKCWIWIAYISEDGYGTFLSDNGKYTKSHRQSWEIHYGKIPNGLHVLHKCDNPSCVNPNHLFLGTNRDNVQDRVRKGRSSSTPGERNGNSKLSEKQVLEIRSRYTSEDISMENLGKEYGVSKGVISCIINRATWKHI